MNDDEILKCVIAFILGWIVCRMIGNGFSVGAQDKDCEECNSREHKVKWYAQQECNYYTYDPKCLNKCPIKEITIENTAPYGNKCKRLRQVNVSGADEWARLPDEADVCEKCEENEKSNDNCIYNKFIDDICVDNCKKPEPERSPHAINNALCSSKQQYQFYDALYNRFG